MSQGDPSAGELRRIRQWDYEKLPELMEYVRGIWWMADWGFRSRGRTFRLSTGGWSGNEEIIEALKRNAMFWMMCWRSSRRGGHYVFRLPAAPKSR